MMVIRQTLGAGFAALILAACGGTPTPTIDEDPPITANLENVSAGSYSLERSHAFLSFQVGHGPDLSSYRVAFTDFNAELSFDPAAPENSVLRVTINPLGVETNYPSDYKAAVPDSTFESWNEDLARDSKWLNADAFPEISFVSTSVQRSSDNSGTVTGDLTFLGATKPITLDVVYNGMANVPWFGDRDLIGFDASTKITRSKWGMDAYLPLIGDSVEVQFSGEFLQDQ